MPARIIYEKGKKLREDSRLTYIEDVKSDKYGRYGLFKCDCGNYTSSNIRSVKVGDSKSCGCYAKEMLIINHTTHGMSETTTYRSWQGMLKRCTNESDSDYKNYGGRGIVVCDEWLNSFETFYEDMGNKPDRHSIDRIDNEKGYNKENCRWATSKQQNRNRRDNTTITFKGITKSIAAWAEDTGIDYHALYARVFQYGWSIEKALTTKARARK